MKKYLSLLLSCLLVFSFAACNQAEKASNADTSVTNGMQEAVNVQFPENFVLIEGGRFGQSLTAISKLVPSAAMGTPCPFIIQAVPPSPKISATGSKKIILQETSKKEVVRYATY